MIDAGRAGIVFDHSSHEPGNFKPGGNFLSHAGPLHFACYYRHPGAQRHSQVAMAEFLYPSFHAEAIDALMPSDGPLHCITSFQFREKAKRKDDLVVLGLGKGRSLSEVSLYENPQNLDLDEGYVVL